MLKAFTFHMLQHMDFLSFAAIVYNFYIDTLIYQIIYVFLLNVCPTEKYHSKICSHE